MADEQADDLTQATVYGSDDFIHIVKNRSTTPASQIIARTYIKTYLDTLYEPIGGGGTGWQEVTETWTRTGNHTFTVAGDLTAKYAKSTLARYKDGGAFEYGVIASSAFSSPNTTINLIPNTSYTMAAGTITDTAISYQATPQGFPHWFNYAAAPTGFSAAPASAIYRWKSLGGNTILINYNEPNNGTSNLTTFDANAPVVAATIAGASWQTVLASTVDNSVLLTTPGRAFISSGSAAITIRKDTANAAWTASGGKRAVFMLVYEF